jgi:hypothetical protein
MRLFGGNRAPVTCAVLRAVTPNLQRGRVTPLLPTARIRYNTDGRHRGGERARRWTGSHRTRAELRDLDKTRKPITANSTNCLALAA